MTIHESLKEHYVRDIELRNLRITTPGHVMMVLQYRVQREAGFRGWGEWISVPVVAAEQEEDRGQ
jgi:hypothetical protein